MVEVLDALRQADLTLARGGTYDDVMAALDAVELVPGAGAYAPGIAQRRVSFSLYFGRPVQDVERALKAQLAVEDDLLRRLHSTGAAYKTHPELRGYFAQEVALLSDIPPCGIRTYVRRLAAGRL